MSAPIDLSDRKSVPMIETCLWIEWRDSDDSDGAARWENVTDEQIDKVIAFAKNLIGQPTRHRVA